MPKGTPRDKSTKRTVLHRLKIARGHLDKVIAMVEGDIYCIDVIHQSSAVRSALSEVNKIVMENHLKTCVADEIRKGKSQEVINEVMKAINKISP